MLCRTSWVFSLNQKVFGLNPVLPNVFNNKYPKLENNSVSVIVRKYLAEMQSARTHFIQCEASENNAHAEH